MTQPRDEAGRFASSDMDAAIRRAAGREVGPRGRLRDTASSSGLDGGATSPREARAFDVDAFIRARSGRGPVHTGFATNKLPLAQE